MSESLARGLMWAEMGLGVDHCMYEVWYWCGDLPTTLEGRSLYG